MPLLAPVTSATAIVPSSASQRSDCRYRLNSSPFRFVGQEVQPVFVVGPGQRARWSLEGKKAWLRLKVQRLVCTTVRANFDGNGWARGSDGYPYRGDGWAGVGLRRTSLSISGRE